MSRFWDALREASRLPERNGEPKVETATEPQGFSGSRLPQGEERQSAISLAAAMEMVLPVTPNGNDHADGNAGQNIDVGIPTTLVPDRTARLIPHATDSSIVEHYRKLRTKLIQAQEARAFRSLVVTSPYVKEGKTVTVVNLAYACAMLPSFKVLVMDGDLRRGTLGKWLGVDDRPGLSNVIDGSATISDVTLKCNESGLHCIPRGTSKVSATELLNSPGLSSHIRRLSEDFALVIIDSPPVNLIADAQLLAAHCDAVLLVVRAFSTTKRALEKAVHDLLPFRVLGTVLNGGTPSTLRRRDRSYYQISP